MKRKIISIICLLLTLCFLLTAFAACSGNKANEDDNQKQQEQGDNPPTPTPPTDPRDAILAKIAAAFNATVTYQGSLTVKESERGSYSETITEYTYNTETGEGAKKFTENHQGDDPYTNSMYDKIIKSGDTYNEYYKEDNCWYDEPYIWYAPMNTLESYLYQHPEKDFNKYYANDVRVTPAYMLEEYSCYSASFLTVQGIEAFIEYAKASANNVMGTTYDITFDIKEEDGKQILELDYIETCDNSDEGEVGSAGAVVTEHVVRTSPMIIIAKDGKILSFALNYSEVITDNAGEIVESYESTDVTEFTYAFDAAIFDSIEIGDAELEPAYETDFRDLVVPVNVNGHTMRFNTYSDLYDYEGEIENAVDCLNAMIACKSFGNVINCDYSFYTDAAFTTPLSVNEEMTPEEFALLFYEGTIYAKVSAPADTCFLTYRITYDYSALDEYTAGMIRMSMEYEEDEFYYATEAGEEFGVYCDNFDYPMGGAEITCTVNGASATLEDYFTTEAGQNYEILCTVRFTQDTLNYLMR